MEKIESLFLTDTWENTSFSLLMLFSEPVSSLKRSVSVSMIRLLIPRYRTCGTRLSVKEGKYELPFSQECYMSFSFSAKKMKNGREKKKRKKTLRNPVQTLRISTLRHPTQIPVLPISALGFLC